MDKQKLEKLLKKYLENSLSKAEENELFLLIDKSSKEEIAKTLPDDDLWLDISHNISAEKSQEIFDAVVGNKDDSEYMEPAINQQPKNWRLILAVAACISVIVVMVFFYSKNEKLKAPQEYAQNLSKVINAPGTYLQTENNKILRIDTLPDGVILDGITKRNNVFYVKNETPSLKNTSIFTSYATTQQLVLEDGSQVWLNASSTLKLHKLSSHSRIIALDGEGYFQVVHNDKKPFQVLVNGKIVEDIGTTFNIKSYGTHVKTTLIEGSVKIDQTVLKPGEQFSDGEVLEVDTASVLAWRKNLFHFKQTELHDILSEITAWYGLKLIIPKERKLQYFDGEMQRNLPIDDVLNILSTMGIQCSIYNKTLAVH